MNQARIAAIVCGLLFLAMLLFTFAGHRLGRRRRKAGDAENAGAGAVDAAVFALLGLLTAFTFSGAYARLDVRRQLIVQEANAIETAYLRLDLLPAVAQPLLRARFLDYADARAAFFVQLIDPTAARDVFARAATIQDDIWRTAVSASAADGLQSARMLLLPALNEMIDVTTTRAVAVQAHPPLLIFLMLFALALACALLIGYGMARAAVLSLVHVVGFAAVTAFTFYIILDIEYPRSGLIHLDASNQLLVDLRQDLERMGAARTAPR